MFKVERINDNPATPNLTDIYSSDQLAQMIPHQMAVMANHLDGESHIQATEKSTGTVLIIQVATYGDLVNHILEMEANFEMLWNEYWEMKF